MNRTQALQNFWSGFGWSAYDENTVPENAEMPRITYSVLVANFDEPVALNASLWAFSRSWAEITAKAEEINNAIGLGGVIIQCDDGALWIKRGVPFYQRMTDPDDMIRRIYINIEVEYLTNR